MAPKSLKSTSHFLRLWMGPDRDVSISSEQFGQLVFAAREIRSTFGFERSVQEKERPVREWAYRSILFSKDLPKGHQITFEDITSKRPGTGIPSKDFATVVGKVLTESVKANTLRNGVNLHDP